MKNPVKQKLSSEVELEVCKCVLFMVFATIQLVYFLPNLLFFLTVDPPQIIQGPENQSVATGNDITFSIEATGDDLQFQWQKDGINIDSSESRFFLSHTNHTSTLCIQCVSNKDQGNYRCLVKNPVEPSGKLSHVAELTMCKLMVIDVKVG